MHHIPIPTGCPITDAGVNLRHGRGDTVGFVPPLRGSVTAQPISHTRVHTPTRVYTRAYGMSPLSGLGAVRYGPLSRNPKFC
jgi:hypothetical protein